MALPVTIPNTFANATSSIPLSQLDANFSTLANAVNGINSGAETLANLKASNVTITGGIISNVTLDNVTVSVETLANVTITDSLIVTANTASDAVRITQIGSGNALVVEDSTNPDSTPFVVNADGRTIIGATSTAASGVSINPFLQVNATGSGASIGLLKWGNDGTQGFVSFAKSRSATVGTYGTAVQSGDLIGAVVWSGDDGTGPIPAAQIVGAVDGTPGTNDMPGRLVFSTTADGASSVTERMRINSNGGVGIGGTAGVAESFKVVKNITGGTVGTGITSVGTIQSDVTGQARLFNTYASTQASSFTLNNLWHYAATQSTFGAGSTVSNQIGFFAENSLTGATNNYGFYSDIASGTGRWNFYANGTAENYLGGNLKIGGTAARGTTAGTNHLSLFNGTAPAGTLTNGVSLYSSSGDFNFMDAAGNGYKVGYRNIPAVGTKTGSYTLAVGDVGKYVQVGSGGSITIPDATFAEGDVVSVFNNTSGNITITCSITTAYIAGTDADKASVTLATRGVATILFISGTVCVISGNVS